MKNQQSLTGTDALALNIISAIKKKKFIFERVEIEDDSEDVVANKIEYRTDTGKASIIVSETRKDSLKNAKVQILITTHSDKKKVVITGKFARRAWVILSTPKKGYAKKVEPPKELVDSISNELGF